MLDMPLSKRLIDFVLALLALLLIYTLAAIVVYIFIHTMNMLSHFPFCLIKFTISQVNAAREFWKTIEEKIAYTVGTVNRLGRQ